MIEAQNALRQMSKEAAEAEDPDRLLADAMEEAEQRERRGRGKGRGRGRGRGRSRGKKPVQHENEEPAGDEPEQESTSKAPMAKRLRRAKSTFHMPTPESEAKVSGNTDDGSAGKHADNTDVLADSVDAVGPEDTKKTPKKRLKRTKSKRRRMLQSLSPAKKALKKPTASSEAPPEADTEEAHVDDANGPENKPACPAKPAPEDAKPRKKRKQKNQTEGGEPNDEPDIANLTQREIDKMAYKDHGGSWLVRTQNNLGLSNLLQCVLENILSDRPMIDEISLLLLKAKLYVRINADLFHAQICFLHSSQEEKWLELNELAKSDHLMVLPEGFKGMSVTSAFRLDLGTYILL